MPIGHQCFKLKIQLHYIDKPTHKERKWWIMISQCVTTTRDPNKSSLPDHTWNWRNQNCKPASDTRSLKCVSPKREAFTPSPQRAHFHVIYQKIKSCQNKEIVFMYNIQILPVRINLYLLFLAQHFNSFDIQYDHRNNIIW